MSLSLSQEVLPVVLKASQNWNTPAAKFVMEEQGWGLVGRLEAQEEDVVLLTVGEHGRAVRDAAQGSGLLGLREAPSPVQVVRTGDCQLHNLELACRRFYIEEHFSALYNAL